VLSRTPIEKAGPRAAVRRPEHSVAPFSSPENPIAMFGRLQRIAADTRGNATPTRPVRTTPRRTVLRGGVSGPPIGPVNSVTSILALQRAAGNQVVSQLLAASIQRDSDDPDPSQTVANQVAQPDPSQTIANQVAQPDPFAVQSERLANEIAPPNPYPPGSVRSDLYGVGSGIVHGAAPIGVGYVRAMGAVWNGLQWLYSQ
jgi:hypothetical protein